MDTNIIIHYFQQEPEVVSGLEGWLRENIELATSAVVEAEVFSWPKMSAKDEVIFKQIFNFMFVIPVDSHVARLGAAMRRQYQTPLHDSLIAATAFLHNAPLVTRNLRDFKKIKEIEVIEI